VSVFGNSNFGLYQKPKVFISYHHQNDQNWYDTFSRHFENVYNLITALRLLSFFAERIPINVVG
jgi:hypothetical protein